MSILNPPTQNRRALINFHGGGKNKCSVLNGSIVGIKQPKYVRFGYTHNHIHRDLQNKGPKC